MGKMKINNYKISKSEKDCIYVELDGKCVSVLIKKLSVDCAEFYKNLRENGIFVFSEKDRQIFQKFIENA